MKYKLINLQTKEEHLCNKVTIDGFDYYVSDENPEPCNPANICMAHKTKRCDKCGKYQGKKIIATNNPNIDIPKVVNDYKNAKWWAADLHGYDKNCELPTNDVEINSFIKGYNKSQETHPNSDEDMIEFADWKGEHYFVQNDNSKWTSELLKFSGCVYTTKELFKLWKEQRPKIVYYNG